MLGGMSQLVLNCAAVVGVSSTKFLGPLLHCEHCITGQEITAAFVLPPQTKKSQTEAQLRVF